MSRHTHGQACSSTAMSAEICHRQCGHGTSIIAQHTNCLYLQIWSSFLAKIKQNSLQVVRAPLTLPPTGHSRHEVAPALLLYHWRPSIEVPSHLPQTKSPPPAFAVPGQFGQCKQQVTSCC